MTTEQTANKALHTGQRRHHAAPGDAHPGHPLADVARQLLAFVRAQQRSAQFHIEHQRDVQVHATFFDDGRRAAVMQHWVAG